MSSSCDFPRIPSFSVGEGELSLLSKRDFLHFSRTDAEAVSPSRQRLLPDTFFSWFKVGISTGNKYHPQCQQ